MCSNPRSFRVTAMSSLVFLACGVPAHAEDVPLTLRGGGLVIIGELIASNKASSVIKSPEFGVMMVESSKFDCTGKACPKPAVPLDAGKAGGTPRS
jgi:hypothetical protein